MTFIAHCLQSLNSHAGRTHALHVHISVSGTLRRKRPWVRCSTTSFDLVPKPDGIYRYILCTKSSEYCLSGAIARD